MRIIFFGAAAAFSAEINNTDAAKQSAVVIFMRM
jgi:hypothetical protein